MLIDVPEVVERDLMLTVKRLVSILPIHFETNVKYEVGRNDLRSAGSSDNFFNRRRTMASF